MNAFKEFFRKHREENPVSAPAAQKYRVTDTLGNTYTWNGADPDAIPEGVFTYGDKDPDTDIVWLKCHDNETATAVFVNAAHVLNLVPLVDVEPVPEQPVAR